MDVESTVEQMLKAAEGPLQKYWKTAEPIAKDEFTKIAQLVEQIGIDRATQKITQEDVVDELEGVKDAFACAMDTQIGWPRLQLRRPSTRLWERFRASSMVIWD